MIIFSPKHLIFRLCCLSRHLKVVLACRKITSVLDNSNVTTKRGHLKHKTTFLKGNYLLSEEVIFWVFCVWLLCLLLVGIFSLFCVSLFSIPCSFPSLISKYIPFFGSFIYQFLNHKTMQLIFYPLSQAF